MIWNGGKVSDSDIYKLDTGQWQITPESVFSTDPAKLKTYVQITTKASRPHHNTVAIEFMSMKWVTENEKSVHCSQIPFENVEM